MRSRTVEVEVLKSLHDDMILWRYMSLDKFINLLDDGGIYFTPLQSYLNSDPYEGYPPAVAIEAIYSSTDSAFEMAQHQIEAAERCEHPNTLEFKEAIQKAKEHLAARPVVFRKLIDTLFKGILVSCWYYSDHQSEAMWKLYSDQGKGVAIKTTVGKLRRALECATGNDRQSRIYIGKVKYLDYADPSLKTKDCIIDGHIMPLLKRISYSHENEVRAFLCPDLDVSNVDAFVVRPYMAHCDILMLIDGVYVSPYTSAPYLKAVKSVAKVFGLPCSVESSNLLRGADDLFGWMDKFE
jgi:hypothetical protein